MVHPKLLGQKSVLSAYIVIEGNVRERYDVRIRWGDGLAIPKKRSDDDEVLLRIECLVLTNKPFVVLDRARIPARVEDCWVLWITKGFVCYTDQSSFVYA